MCNIINRQQQLVKPFLGSVACYVAHIFYSRERLPGYFITANEKLVNGFAVGKAIAYPLQDPIKNIICHPE